jgi:MoaA/NifB/PqqE/SkfB family radical SAM enzyme
MPDIPFWNKCDNRCVMCTNGAGFASQAPGLYGLKAQIGKLERYLKGMGAVYLKNSDKADFISLTGGEPTMHPDFFRLLVYFRKRLPGVYITLLSNGRRFADEQFARRFAKAAKPPFTAAVPVHGASARVHDLVAGVPGAFKETMAGLDNLFSYCGVRIEIRVVLHRLNIGDLRKLLAFLLKRFPAADRWGVAVIHYEIEGMSSRNHKSLALKLSESARVINAALPLIAKFRDLRLYHFPLCLIREELRPNCRITLPDEDRIYTEKCSGCRVRKRCLGLMKEYYRRFGDGELKTQRRKR